MNDGATGTGGVAPGASQAGAGAVLAGPAQCVWEGGREAVKRLQRVAARVLHLTLSTLRHWQFVLSTLLGE